MLQVPRFTELCSHLSEASRAQLAGWCRSTRNASAIVATVIAAHEREGFAWEVVDRAVLELGASRDGTFSAKGLRVFCKDLVRPAEERPEGRSSSSMDEGERFLALTRGDKP